MKKSLLCRYVMTPPPQPQPNQMRRESPELVLVPFLLSPPPQPPQPPQKGGRSGLMRPPGHRRHHCQPHSRWPLPAFAANVARWAADVADAASTTKARPSQPPPAAAVATTIATAAALRVSATVRSCNGTAPVATQPEGPKKAVAAAETAEAAATVALTQTTAAETTTSTTATAASRQAGRFRRPPFELAGVRDREDLGLPAKANGGRPAGRPLPCQLERLWPEGGRMGFREPHERRLVGTGSGRLQ